MPYTIDRARITSRLASFLSKLIERKPVDTFFQRYPVVDRLYKRKVSSPGAQPVMFPVGDGLSPNFRRGDAGNLYAVIGSAGDNVMRMATERMVNMYDQLIISGRERRELSEPRLVDRMAYQYDKIINTNLRQKSVDLFAAAQAVDAITCLPIAILATGELHGVDQADVAGWASNVANHAGADFSVGGYERMQDLHRDIVDDKGNPSLIVMSSTLHRKLEMEYDADIRYAKTGELVRGATGIKFKEVECIWDPTCNASTIYFLDLDKIEMRVNSDCDMSFDELVERQDQDAHGALFKDEFQLIIKDRRAQGKIINIV